LRNAQLPSFNGDGKDGASGVLLLRRGNSREIAIQPGAVEPPLEYLGVGDGTIWPIGVVHAVQGKGRRVEIALWDNAGGVDEALVVGATVNGGAVEVSCSAQRTQAGIDDGVGLRKQTRGLRRSRLAQPHCHHQSAHQRKHQQKRVPRSFTHL
jgi:hypothetical protein